MSGARTVFRILGCGSSPGVPRIGNDWGQCDPRNPRNRRRRSSLLVTRHNDAGGRTRVLVDTGPDLREQMLDAEVDWVDGVVYTHAHADHIHGIDDLRSFVLNRRRRVDVYLDTTTSERVIEAFGYCFVTPPGSHYPPIVNEHRLTPGNPVTIEGEGGAIETLPYAQDHGDITSLGFRFGNVGYSPDISGLREESIAAMSGLDVLIIDSLRWTPHASHFSVDQALAVIERLQPKRAILTHMHIDLDYKVLAAYLPKHVEPAYDGMEFEA
jgi:phosphoribosyl 1,2-cyclic phosphate phosphodiesterase